MMVTPEVAVFVGLVCSLIGAAIGYGLRMGRQGQLIAEHAETIRALKAELERCVDKLTAGVQRVEDSNEASIQRVLTRLDSGSVTLGKLDASVKALDQRVARIENCLNGQLR